ncbi:hypothetical protein ANN_19002 [Periplaneta americana]|uniref:Uncharacterized protein n=1 Tax=Periplaneta americana TaxID=6978 RepID=A0ABQ8SRM2_PERAM|nr:hypothetical protein ANN_19002 [Periplaneta americana]
MTGLCEGGNEPPGSLKANYLTFALRLVKISDKTKRGDQPKRESNPRPSSTPDRQASALADRATPVASVVLLEEH